MTDEEQVPDQQPPLLNFARLGDQMRSTAIMLCVLATAGAVVEGLADGLTFAVLFRWAIVFVVGFVLCAGILAGVHAVRGADTAHRRGQRLSSDDVGLLPPHGRRDDAD